MKGECFREKLERAVRHASRMTSKNPSLPVLSCVLIEARKGIFTVRATNIDVAYEASVPARVEKEGVVAVSGAALNTFLSGVSAQQVLLSTAGSGFVVSSGNASATFKTFPHDDFPSFAAPKGKGHSFPTTELVRGLKSVLYSAAVSSVRPELGSIYIASEGQGVVFAATDSFRLAEQVVFPPQEVSLPTTLLPAKNAGELLRILSEAESDTAMVESDNGHFIVMTNGLVFTSRVVDGAFPDYKQIIPKEAKTTVTLLKEDFGRALQLTSALSEKTNQISLSVPEKGKELTLSVKNAEVGEGASALPAAITGEAFDASFNARYLSDCLGAIPESSITLSFAGPGKPLVITGAGSKHFRYIVMPMNR